MARKGSPLASFVSWAMQLPTAGMNPLPPPQDQVDAVKRAQITKQDAESSGADV